MHSWILKWELWTSSCICYADKTSIWVWQSLKHVLNVHLFLSGGGVITRTVCFNSQLITCGLGAYFSYWIAAAPYLSVHNFVLVFGFLWKILVNGIAREIVLMQLFSSIAPPICGWCLNFPLSCRAFEWSSGKLGMKLSPADSILSEGLQMIDMGSVNLEILWRRRLMRPNWHNIWDQSNVLLFRLLPSSFLLVGWLFRMQFLETLFKDCFRKHKHAVVFHVVSVDWEELVRNPKITECQTTDLGDGVVHHLSRSFGKSTVQISSWPCSIRD